MSRAEPKQEQQGTSVVSAEGMLDRLTSRDASTHGERSASFGDELRRARELRQISLREVSEATKINLRYLQAMEANEFEVLPGGVFNRGFVRAYSQFVGVDPDAMVDAYVAEENQYFPQGRVRRVSAVGTARVPDPSPEARQGSSMLLWLAVAGVAAAALLIGWWMGVVGR